MKSADDPFDLERFLDAQQGVHARALDELHAGQKVSHWMWFVFPQIEGLGVSATAHRYAIRSIDEARAYLQHPLLGERLRQCTAAVNRVRGRTARQIFGTPDDMKFRSSMTLFGRAAPPGSEFESALKRYFSGEPDARTLELLDRCAGDDGRGD